MKALSCRRVTCMLVITSYYLATSVNSSRVLRCIDCDIEEIVPTEPVVVDIMDARHQAYWRWVDDIPEDQPQDIAGSCDQSVDVPEIVESVQLSSDLDEFPPSEETANSTQADSSSISLKVVGGNEVPPGQAQFVVGLRKTLGGPNLCGGTLITPRIILTAAHCLPNIRYASIGSSALSGNGGADSEQIKVARVMKHPFYVAATHTNDFLLAELETPSKFPPISLASDVIQMDPSVNVRVRGWGTTSEGGHQSNTLLQVDLPIQSNEECSKILPNIDNTMLCAGGQAGIDSCQGDSGGPLTLTRNGKDILVGVVSWGIGCGRAGMPGVYGRVSSAKEFINQNIQGINWM